MATFSDYAAATRTRDIVSRLVSDQVSRERPSYRYATVQQIDRITRQCIVAYPGEEGEVSGVVAMGAIQPLEVGQTVRVDGRVGDRYISDVMGQVYLMGSLDRRIMKLDNYLGIYTTYYPESDDANVIFLASAVKNSYVGITTDATTFFPTGTELTIVNANSAYRSGFLPNSGVKIYGPRPHLRGIGSTSGAAYMHGGSVTLRKIDTNTWVATGDLDSPSVGAWNSVGASINSGVWTSIPMAQGESDPFNMHSLVSSTDRFTVPSGWAPANWNADVRVVWSASTGNGVRGLRILRSDGWNEVLDTSAAVWIYGANAATGYVQVYLDPGQYVSFQLWQDTGGLHGYSFLSANISFARLSDDLIV